MESNINFNQLISHVGSCCLTESICKSCAKEACLIGYCKKILLTCLKNDDELVTGGLEDIPNFDTKFYDEGVIIDTIGFILNQCKNCNLYHDEDCIINVTRSALEVILLGEHQDYKGSVMLYLSEVKRLNPELAQRIHQAYENQRNAIK